MVLTFRLPIIVDVAYFSLLVVLFFSLLVGGN